MAGQFSRIERHVTDEGQCLAFKTYSKSHGHLVHRHYARELWASKQLDIKTPEESIEKHIILLMDQIESPTSYQLVFPYYPKSLQEVLFNGKQIACQFMQQVTQGLTYLHDRDIIHCDLSPSNILIDHDGTMFISDFGCAQRTGWAELETIGTCYYLAPEHLFNYKRFAPSTDIWSLGVIFTVLMTGIQVFDGDNSILQLGRIKFRLGRPSKKTEKEELMTYPDYHKLMFFDDDDDDGDIEYDSVEEYEQVCAMRKPLQEILQEQHVESKYQQLILGMLTWSIKDRFTLLKIKTFL